jgi:hypothetical protein
MCLSDIEETHRDEVLFAFLFCPEPGDVSLISDPLAYVFPLHLFCFLAT